MGNVTTEVMVALLGGGVITATVAGVFNWLNAIRNARATENVSEKEAEVALQKLQEDVAEATWVRAKSQIESDKKEIAEMNNRLTALETERNELIDEVAILKQNQEKERAENATVTKTLTRRIELLEEQLKAKDEEIERLHCELEKERKLGNGKKGM